MGLTSCGTWAFSDLLPMESSWTRNWTRVPCVGRWIFIHCTTKEALKFLTMFAKFFCHVTNIFTGYQNEDVDIFEELWFCQPQGPQSVLVRGWIKLETAEQAQGSHRGLTKLGMTVILKEFWYRSGCWWKNHVDLRIPPQPENNSGLQKLSAENWTERVSIRSFWQPLDDHINFLRRGWKWGMFIAFIYQIFS